jgi:hypothetical protein
MNDQQNGYTSALADSTKVPANVRAAADSLKKAMDPVRTKLGLSTGDPFSFDMEQFRKNMQFRMGMLKGPIMSATLRPTATQMRQIGELRNDIPALVNEVNSLVPQHQAVMKLLAESGLYPAAVKPVP